MDLHNAFVKWYLLLSIYCLLLDYIVFYTLQTFRDSISTTMTPKFRGEVRCHQTSTGGFSSGMFGFWWRIATSLTNITQAHPKGWFQRIMLEPKKTIWLVKVNYDIVLSCRTIHGKNLNNFRYTCFTSVHSIDPSTRPQAIYALTHLQSSNEIQTKTYLYTLPKPNKDN